MAGGRDRFDYFARQSWSTAFHHLTWYRIIGLCYIAIFLVGVVFVICLIVEHCSTAERREEGARLFEPFYSIRLSRRVERSASSSSTPRLTAGAIRVQLL